MSLRSQALFSNKSFWFAIALAMFDSATGIICNIYSYSIILSNYPATGLIYYIVLQTILTALLRNLGLRLLSHNYKKSALVQYACFIALFLSCILLMQLKAHLIPFIVAVLLSGITSLATIICWSILSLAFGMREYKSVAKYCNQAAYLSSIIFSFAVPLIVLFFSNIALLIFATLLLILSTLTLSQLSLIPEEKKALPNKKIKPKSIKYPLYHYMMIFTVLISTLMGISQYIMRIEAAAYFSQEQLSSFFGYFSGLTNCLGLLVASSSERVLKRYGLQSLLYSIPLITLINALVVLIHPNFWSIMALGAIRAVFGYSYGAYSAEISLNILPANIRFISKANIKSTANIASTILLVVFTLGKSSLQFITLWLVPLSIAALFFAYKVKQYYKITLQQESAFKRFNILEELTPATRPILNDLALKAIQEKDEHTVLYGLDLLNKLYVQKALPLAVYHLLEHEKPQLRSEVIKLIHAKKASEALNFLSARLPKETIPELQRQLLELLAYLDLNTALNLTRYTASPFAPVIENLYLLLNEQKPCTLQFFAELRQNPNPQLRQMLAALIGQHQLRQLADHLKSLVNDPEPCVRDEALAAAALLQDQDLIPALIHSLLRNKNNITPQLALRSYGKSALDALLNEALQLKHSRVLIKLIASIPAQEAEATLITIAQKATMYHRSLVANYANERVCKLASTTEFKQQAHALMREELSMILSLKKQQQEIKQATIQTELEWRIILAKTLFIQWLAIANSPKEINQLIISLVRNNGVDESIFDKAIELLELYIQDKEIRTYLAFLFEDPTTVINSSTLPPPYLDSCMEQIMSAPDQTSPLLSIVFELRAVRLFHDLPTELLLALAEDAQYLQFTAGEVIFAKNDLSDGLYCLSQGEVHIIRDEQTVSRISQHGFFGELALLDNAPRVASALAQTDCVLLFIDKEVFNRIADDVPDILRTVIQVILEYLRSNLEQRS